MSYGNYKRFAIDAMTLSEKPVRKWTGCCFSSVNPGGTSTLHRNKRSTALLVSVISVLLGLTSSPVSSVSVVPKPKFTLTKGKKVEVCEAYLKRLNTTEFQNWPYCDRPESIAVDGFTYLNRMPLTAKEVSALFMPAYRFVRYGNQNAVISNLREIMPFNSIQDDLESGVMRVWRYSPEVDIDNDGRPDSLVVWHGGLGGSFSCGGLDKANQPMRQGQWVLSIDVLNGTLNEKSTREFFGHPLGGYSSLRKGRRVRIFQGFRPIGETLSIFKYRNLYYFDTFFDSWGDFENRRQDDRKISHTLGVFVRAKNKTTQPCELRWINPVTKY